MKKRVCRVLRKGLSIDAVHYLQPGAHSSLRCGAMAPHEPPKALQTVEYCTLSWDLHTIGEETRNYETKIRFWARQRAPSAAQNLRAAINGQKRRIMAKNIHTR